MQRIQGSRALLGSSEVVVEVQGGQGVQLELMVERARADQTKVIRIPHLQMLHV